MNQNPLNKIRIQRIRDLLEQKAIDDAVINGSNYRITDKHYSLSNTISDEDADTFIMNKKIEKYRSFVDYLEKYSSNREEFKTYYNDSIFNGNCDKIELELYRLWIIHRIINIDEYIGPTEIKKNLRKTLCYSDNEINEIEQTYDDIKKLSQKKIDSRWYDGLLTKIKSKLNL